MSTEDAIADLQNQVAALQATSDDYKQALNNTWLLLNGFLVFWLQAGFAMLEGGSVRAKNLKNILMKNMLDAVLGILIWWAVGYGIAFGQKDSDWVNPFIGTSQFFLYNNFDSAEDRAGGNVGVNNYSYFMFQYAFAATAGTITSGAVAERCEFSSYFIYTVFMIGWIYPIVVHWVWALGGWMSMFQFSEDLPHNVGVMDFAGAGVVHMLGGFAALVACAIMGPRHGRFDTNKKPVAMPGHSIMMVVLGTFILWLGFYSFNAGSVILVTGGFGYIAARAAVCTTISAGTCGLVVLIMDRWINKYWDVAVFCNGCIAGLVASVANCALVEPWAACWVGLVGAFVYYGGSKMNLYWFKLDDPVDAIAIHGYCGMWSVWALGFFAQPTHIAEVYGSVYNEPRFWGFILKACALMP